MITQWSVAIPQLSGKRHQRRVYVYVPDMATENPEMRFPVLYMFDGHNVFFDADATYGKSWGFGDYLSYTDTPLMVVAVECNHGPKFARLKEYSPFTFRDPKFGTIVGKGKVTMDWFTKELKPTIDQQFPTLPDREHTYLAGSSMGGLMALYGLCAYSSVFGKAAALSPSLWTSPRQVRKMVHESPIGSETILYMDYGEKEMPYHQDMKKTFLSTVSSLLDKGVNITARIVPGGTHSEASWEKQIPFFIDTLLYGTEDD